MTIDHLVQFISANWWMIDSDATINIDQPLIELVDTCFVVASTIDLIVLVLLPPEGCRLG